LIFRYLVSALIVLSAAQSYAQKSTPLDESSGSSVKIVSITPATAKPLKDGEQFTVSAEIDYVLAAPKGKLSVFVQSESGRSLLVSCTNPPISTGKGRVTIAADILVKDAYSVQFIVALYHNDGRSTAVTASRSYVVDKQ
jgi:hypothetical protein